MSRTGGVKHASQIGEASREFVSKGMLAVGEKICSSLAARDARLLQCSVLKVSPANAGGVTGA